MRLAVNFQDYVVIISHFLGPPSPCVAEGVYNRTMLQLFWYLVPPCCIRFGVISSQQVEEEFLRKSAGYCVGRVLARMISNY